jgi:2-polyprenyl-3-methyl-5-hydroxy-6-metoxy-1,4-benzoquinol methylase
MSAESDLDVARAREARWQEEAGFFDEAARRVDAADLAIDPLALHRYTRPVLRRRFSKEFRFRLLGPLARRRVLDVGCGDGLNTVMFARMGAQVTGIDISAGALDVARRRALASGVSARVDLVCGPIEQADLPAGAFDVVWGDGILHHVLDDLPLVLERLVRLARPGGLILFAEPINLSPALRRLRGLIPVQTDATPGERPMVRSEIDLVRRHVPDLRVRHYGLLGRLDRFILVHHNYERSPAVRRAIANAVDAVDWALLSLPFVRRLASTCVMYGHAAPDGGRRATRADARADARGAVASRG